MLVCNNGMTELEYAKDRLAYYKAKPPYKTRDRGSFGWGEEISFWRKEEERLEAIKEA